MLRRQPACGARQIELDDLGRARADEEQQLDLRAAREEAIDHPVELLVAVGHAGEVALLDDCGGEARFGENHHACRRLEQMRAGARADDEEEGVLDLAMEPDDAGEAAEDLALPPFAQDRGAIGAGRCDGGKRRGHAVAPSIARSGADCSRAARNLRRNCVALTA